MFETGAEHRELNMSKSLRCFGYTRIEYSKVQRRDAGAEKRCWKNPRGDGHRQVEA